MKKLLIFGAVLACFVSDAAMAQAAKQEALSERGAHVMPFRLDATTHVFTPTSTGGTQRVIANNPQDAEQIRLVRRHLQDIAKQFSQGDFSAPTHIHGGDMPGLAVLRRAKSSEIKIRYAPMEKGGQLTYTTANPELIQALHGWFDAQLSDHGSDAMAGHRH